MIHQAIFSELSGGFLAVELASGASGAGGGVLPVAVMPQIPLERGWNRIDNVEEMERRRC